MKTNISSLIELAHTHKCPIITSSKERAKRILNKAYNKGIEIEVIPIRSFVYNQQKNKSRYGKDFVIDNTDEVLSAIGIEVLNDE